LGAGVCNAFWIVGEAYLEIFCFSCGISLLRPCYISCDARFFASLEVFSSLVALVGQNRHLVHIEDCLGFAHHNAELALVRRPVYDFPVNPEVVLGVNNGLGVIANICTVVMAIHLPCVTIDNRAVSVLLNLFASPSVPTRGCNSVVLPAPLAP